MPIYWRMDKYIVVFPYEGILDTIGMHNLPYAALGMNCKKKPDSKDSMGYNFVYIKDKSGQS